MPAMLAFPENRQQAKQLATAMAIAYHEVVLHHFPDGESKVVVPESLAEQVVIYRTLDHPNEKLIELLLCAQTLRQQGVQEVTLVAPYMCYMRQDKAFSPGEAVSQQIIGQLLANYFDNVITVDAHLHRITTLSEAIPVKQAVNLSAARLLGEFLAQQTDRPLLIGPDEESKQWVSHVAELDQFDYAVARKQRHGDRSVSITLPNMPVAQRKVVLVDDVVSSGHTLAECAQQLYTAGAASVAVLVTHPLFADEAEVLLLEAGITSIWSSDSITHPSNCVSLTPLLASALQTVLAT